MSILVPVYNVEKFFPRCLNSLFTQTYKNIEYVFVDDASTDGSLCVLHDALDAYAIPQERCRIIQHPFNKGVAVSRIDCIANAQGDYVQFVDSDDWIEPTATADMVEATQEGRVDIVGCHYIMDYEGKGNRYVQENYGSTPYENMIRSIDYDLFPGLYKLLIKRSLFDHFEISPYINIGEDHIISIKLYYYAKTFVALDKYLYHYVQYNPSCLSAQRKRGLMDHVKVVGELERFFTEEHLVDPRIIKQLNLRKFNIKSNFLTKEMYDLNLYKTIFPEADKMWRYFNYSRNEQIKFWLAEKHLYGILKLLLKLKR